MIRNPIPTLATAAAVALGLAAAPAGAATITVGDEAVRQGEQAVFDVIVILDEDEQFTNTDLIIQVGGGDLDVGGDDTGPTIASLELIDGTVYEGTGATGTVTFDGTRTKASTTIVPVGGTPFSEGGVVAVLTVDTTGVVPGTYDVLFEIPGVGGSNTFDPRGDTLDTVINGSVTVAAIPEPASLAGLGLMGLALRRRRA